MKPIELRMQSRGGLFSNLNFLLRVSAQYPQEQPLRYFLSGWPYIRQEENVLDLLLSQPSLVDKEIINVNDHWDWSKGRGVHLGPPNLSSLNKAFNNHFGPLIKPSILKTIQQFCDRNFTPNTLGIHIRSTDRAVNVQSKDKWKPLPPELICTEARHYFKKFKCTKLFIATDYTGYRDALLNEFKDSACFYSDHISPSAIRAPHNRPSNGEVVAQEAFIDMLLLSKCTRLLRTTSNLTVFALSVQKIPFVDLSVKHSMFLAGNETWLQKDERA